MSDGFRQASIHARDWADADWRCLWLRINLLLRDMTHLFRDRRARPVLKVELNKAIAMRERMKHHVWWN
jgi:hypothetical protein